MKIKLLWGLLDIDITNDNVEVFILTTLEIFAVVMLFIVIAAP